MIVVGSRSRANRRGDVGLFFFFFLFSLLLLPPTVSYHQLSSLSLSLVNRSTEAKRTATIPTTSKKILPATSFRELHDRDFLANWHVVKRDRTETRAFRSSKFSVTENNRSPSRDPGTLGRYLPRKGEEKEKRKRGHEIPSL